MAFINVADLPSDTPGKTWREKNRETKHNIPVGALVELDTGARAFVMRQDRDCDGTPLYALCVNNEDTEDTGHWDFGYGEDGLREIVKK